MFEPPEPGRKAASFEPIQTRMSLLSRLKDWNDDDSWRRFFDTYWRLILGVALRSGLSEAEAQDVVQETVIAVAKNIPEFQYDRRIGSFKSWLLVQTRWRIVDQFRKRKGLVAVSGSSNQDSPGVIDTLPDTADSELEGIWDQEWKTHLLELARQRLKTRVNPKEYQIFDLSVVKKLSPAEVMKAIGVSRTHVYVAKHRVGALLKQEIKKLEEQMTP